MRGVRLTSDGAVVEDPVRHDEESDPPTTVADGARVRCDDGKSECRPHQFCRSARGKKCTGQEHNARHSDRQQQTRDPRAHACASWRRLRRSGCEVLVCETAEQVSAALTPERRHDWDAVVLSGSSLNVSESLETSRIAKDLMVLVHMRDVALLGICFGMQLLAVANGGRVRAPVEMQDGARRVTFSDGSPLAAAGSSRRIFHHQDVVAECPASFVVDARCERDVVARSARGTDGTWACSFIPRRAWGRRDDRSWSGFAHRAKLPHARHPGRAHQPRHVRPDRALARRGVTHSRRRALRRRSSDSPRGVEPFRARFRIPPMLA